MTTYNKSATASISGGSATQNVTTADTVVFTVSGGVSTYSSISGSNCTRNKTSMSSGSSVTITFSSSNVGNWSCTVGGFDNSKEPQFYFATISGTVSSAATQYSVTSGTISMDGVRDFLTTASSSSISMNAFYKGGSLVPNISQNSGVPSSGTIDLADLYGVYNNS